jgi:hypothetical protein
VKRPRTTGERALLIIYALLAASCWFGFLEIVFHFEVLGASAGTTWLIRGIVLAGAALITVALVRSAVRQWRRIVREPVPVKGVRGWFARQPVWPVAVMLWISMAAAFDLPTILIFGVLGHRGLHTHPAPIIDGLLAAAVVAAVNTLRLKVQWRRQAENVGTASQPG